MNRIDQAHIDQAQVPTYAAFLSYSRAVDGELAPRLQQALQRFAKPWYRRRALRVFRDDANLSANPGLWSSIQAALDASEYFILLASPESAASPWVGQEVEYWLGRRSPGTLLIAVTDGEIGWDRARGDFDRATTCVPAALYGRLPEEPRWIDLRGARGLASLPPAMVADLAAPLHHRDKDELIGEDLRLHRRAMRLARAGVTVLAITTVAAVVAAVVAVVQARVATERRNEAQEQQRIATARALTASAANATRTNPALALRLGLAAVAVDPGPEARAGLVDALLTTRYVGEVGRLDEATHVAHAATAARLVTASGTMLRAFDTTDPGAATELGSADDDVFSLALSPDGATLAVGAQRGTLALYRLDADGRPDLRWRSAAGLAGEARALAFSPDGRTLLADHDGEPTLWDVTDPAAPIMRGALAGVPDAVTAAFAPAGDVVAIGRPDGTVSLWDAATRQLLAQASAGPDTRRVAFTGDGRTLVTASSDAVAVWDVADRSRLAALTRLGDTAPTDLAVADDRLVVGDASGEVHLWDLRDPASPRRLGQPWAATRGPVHGLALGGDGDVLYTAGRADLFGSAVVAWDLTDRPARTTSVTGPGGAVAAVAANADGTRVATAGADRRVTLWDAAALRPLASVDLGEQAPRSVALTDDATLMAAGSDDGRVHLWDVRDPASPRELSTWPVGAGPVRALAFAPAGAFGVAYPLLYATVDGTIGGVAVLGLADPTRPEDSPLSSQAAAAALAFSPDGRTMVVGGSRVSVRATTEDPQLRADGRSTGMPADVTSIAVSPDSTTVAAGLASGAVQLLRVPPDAGAPEPVGLPLPAGGVGVTSLAFAPDGRTLAVADAVGTVALWDVGDPGRPHLLGPVLTDGGAGVRFRPDGTLVVGRSRGGIALWDLAFADAARADPTAVACAIVREGLTRDEWQRYVPALEYRETC